MSSWLQLLFAKKEKMQEQPEEMAHAEMESCCPRCPCRTNEEHGHDCCFSCCCNISKGQPLG